LHLVALCGEDVLGVADCCAQIATARFKEAIPASDGLLEPCRRDRTEKWDSFVADGEITVRCFPLPAATSRLNRTGGGASIDGHHGIEITKK
jgi:hypothetical protein